MSNLHTLASPTMPSRFAAATSPVCALLAATLAMPCYAAQAQQLSPPEPAATTEPSPAEQLRGEAVTAFDAGDYQTALDRFEAAYAESAEPTDLYNIGRIHEELGNLSEALDHYERFVNSPHLQLEERRRAADRIEVLRLVVEEDEPQASEASFTPQTGAPPADRPRDPAQPLIVSGGALLGLGAAVAAAGGVAFGLRARRASEDINALSAGRNPSRLTLTEAEDLDTRGRNAEVLQITFLAAGGVVAGVGATLLGLGLAKRKRGPAVQASVSPHHGFVSAAWRF